MFSVFQKEWIGKWLIPYDDLSHSLPAGKALRSNFARIFISSMAHLRLNPNGLFISLSIELWRVLKCLGVALKSSLMSVPARTHSFKVVKSTLTSRRTHQSQQLLLVHF